MIPPAAQVALVVLALSLAASGAALLLLRRGRVAGALLALGGLGLTTGVVLDATARPDPARAVFWASGLLAVGLAVVLYPAPDWRHPADVAALLSLVVAGLVGSMRADDIEAVGSSGLVVGVALIAHTWWKLERAGPADRRALTWLALVGSVAGLVSGFVAFVLPTTTSGVFVALLWSALGPAMYVGLALPEVVDVRGLVVRTVVLVFALVGYLALFMVAASAVETVGGRAPAVGTLALVGAVAAVTFHPLQVVLRGVVDELLFGRRPDPLGAASRVAGQLGDDPLLALEAIREALVLPHAALRVDGAVVAATGEPATHTRSWPLALGADTAAELVVGLRPGDLTLPATDGHVLRLVAPLLAQTLRAHHLARDLQESRGQTVAAREEERRRVRRDLHDGLGPRLSGIAFTSDAARNLVGSDPDAAAELLGELRAETTRAIEDIRRLVYAMRPPALDELGLVPALRQQTTGLRTRSGALRVDLVAPPLPALPAAVEVAAYRIVMEAVTNVARHSGTERATVRLGLASGGLAIEVTDAGTGSRAGSGAWTSGVGLSSMRERAVELGGTLSAGSTPAGGRVAALLPFGLAEPAG